MATDNDAIARDAKAGWRGFCWFISLSALMAASVLGLMAIFLL